MDPWVHLYPSINRGSHPISIHAFKLQVKSSIALLYLHSVGQFSVGVRESSELCSSFQIWYRSCTFPFLVRLYFIQFIYIPSLLYKVFTQHNVILIILLFQPILAYICFILDCDLGLTLVYDHRLSLGALIDPCVRNQSSERKCKRGAYTLSCLWLPLVAWIDYGCQQVVIALSSLCIPPCV